MSTHLDFCRHCDRKVILGPRWSNGRRDWWHLAADGSLRRGCRAASFTDEYGWDDSIPRTRLASVKVSAA
jgi:hypothetical protein